MTAAEGATSAAILAANLRYWPTVAPSVGSELRRWSRYAEAIPDRKLKALALAKLAGEHFNAQVAATLATTAPLRAREKVTRAIVAYQVMYDYLDGLTEQAVPEHLHSNRCLYRAFTDAIAGAATAQAGDGDYYLAHPSPGDGGYLQALSHAVSETLARLPAAGAVRECASASARRCAEAQARVHAAGPGDQEGLAAWAREQAAGSMAAPGDTPLGWREWLAGAVSCVLGVHALIAAAAEPATTPRRAQAIDQAYLPVAALSTMLDSLVDWHADRARGQTPWLLSHYDEHPLELVAPLRETAACAARRTQGLPHAAHHLMTMTGVIAYYASSPTAAEPHMSPAVEELQRELGAALSRAIGVMRAWRACKRIFAARPLLKGSSSPCTP